MAIAIEPLIGYRTTVRNGETFKLEVDSGQDQIWLDELGLNESGEAVEVRTRLGYCLRKPGSPVNFIVDSVSDSVRRQVKLAIAERDAELSGDDTLDWYGRQRVNEHQPLESEACMQGETS